MTDNSKRVYLRALTQSDLDRVLNWHNDAELYSTLGGHLRFVNLESETQWLRHRLEAQDEVNLGICLADPGEHIGNIYLRNIDWVHRNGELHTFIARREHRGKGYGSEAVKQLLRHAFEDLGLLRIYLHVLASNTAAIAMYEKCGFALEGRLRRHVFKKGAFEDMLVMGLCRE
jgi:RimJ/RimL family protein N-acetyltransferase